MTEREDAARRAAALIRDVADFPSPGIVFKDIGPLLADGDALGQVVEALAQPWAGRVDVVAGIESRGFLLGVPLALRLGTGFVPLRKMGKLPGAVISASYSLEYAEATLQVQADVVGRDARVLVVDDVLATGGTAVAAYSLLDRVGAKVVGISVLLEIAALNGRDVIVRTATNAELDVLVQA